jgi:L-rhamnose isomerase
VVTFNDDLQAIAQEIVRNNALERIHVGLDYFDASINRVGAWVIGARSTLKALLAALLEPRDQLRAFENQSNYFSRLALLEEVKTLPFGTVWDYFCLKSEVPDGEAWMREVQRYEKEVLSRR